jgi:hypothetical protein
MSLRILADFHHHALWQSYVLLARRFGWELYRPIGMEWFDAGYWQFEKKFHGDLVARQYLSTLPDDVDRGDHSERPDRKNPGETFRMVTLDQFRAQHWDVVVASVPDNERGFASLAGAVGAKYVVQVGNEGQHIDRSLRPIVLASAANIAYDVGVTYHQEFDLGTFRYEPPTGFGPVSSFVNCFPETPEYPRFLDLARAHPDLDCRVFGAYGSAPLDEFAQGDIEATPAVANAMRASGLIYHAKYWSDGYGHVIHNAFAVGRPVLGSLRYYQHKMAEPLWVEGVTSFDIDRLGSRDEAADLIRSLRADPERYVRMCEAAAARFREVVDFDAEAEAIRGVLE